jgi:hypothetical protein
VYRYLVVVTVHHEWFDGLHARAGDWRSGRVATLL